MRQKALAPLERRMQSLVRSPNASLLLKRAALGTIMTRKQLFSVQVANETQPENERALSKDRPGMAFNTLHDLQKSSCLLFSENQLFGTHKPSTDENGEHEWMTYKEFDNLVDKTRALLQDVGKIQKKTFAFVTLGFCLSHLLLQAYENTPRLESFPTTDGNGLPLHQRHFP